MKKISFFIIIAVFVLAFASCTREEPREEYVNDRYFYETLRLSDSGLGVLVEFDIVGGSARIPCPDPLCGHGEDCLLTDIDGCRTSKNCVYFYKDGFRAYNPAKNEITLLFESGAQVFGPGQGAGNTVYFTVYSYDYDDTGMVTGSGHDVYRYDEQTYKLEKLTEEKLANKVDFVECKGEKIIWSFFGEGKYTTDLNFQNKTPYEAPKEEYTLEINSRLPHSGVAFECYMKNNESGEKTLVFPPAYSYRYANYEKKDSFFYVPARLEQIGVDEATGEPIYAYRPTNKLVYINAYDTSDTYTWEFPEGMGITTAFMHADNHREVGKYVAFPCNKTEYGEAGERHTYGGIFVVDTQTKETFTLFYCEESRTID
ncbi:MAG: hypothetical protein IJW21_05345 [Clostridia bacterium]|nr:hypothetical protein [Clostridia bacterium]